MMFTIEERVVFGGTSFSWMFTRNVKQKFCMCLPSFRCSNHNNVCNLINKLDPFIMHPEVILTDKKKLDLIFNIILWSPIKSVWKLAQEIWISKWTANKTKRKNFSRLQQNLQYMKINNPKKMYWWRLSRPVSLFIKL